MNKAMQTILEVNQQAENFYADAILLGDHAAYALGVRHRSQMTGLENIAESALKASDILDYIKRQTARFSYWRQTFPTDPSTLPSSGRPEQSASANRSSEERDIASKVLGERLKLHLEGDLMQKLDVICSKGHLNIDDKTEKRHIYLLLIRQFIRQMVAQYEYRVSFEDTKRGV